MKLFFLSFIFFFVQLKSKVIYEDKKYKKEIYYIHNDFELKTKLKKSDYKILHNFLKLSNILKKKKMFKLSILRNKKDKINHFKQACFISLDDNKKYELFYVYKYRTFYLKNNDIHLNKINNIFVNKQDLLEQKTKHKINLIVPLKYIYISSPFSKKRFHPILHRWLAHKGIDYVNKTNTKIVAASDGVVSYVGRYGSYGKYVKIKHKNGFYTEYAHLNKYAMIRRGDKVKQGQIIGYLGNTGRSTGPHLHFGLFYKGKAVNPIYYYNNKNTKKNINKLYYYSKKNNYLNHNYLLNKAIKKKSKFFNKL